MSSQFFYFDPHIFGQISSILVIKQVLYNIFQSTIEIYNFCMIPHSLIFSFILAHFGLRQNPTGLQEAIQGSDKTSKTTLIIKSTLERLFLMKKHQKKHFWNFALFTRFNLLMMDVQQKMGRIKLVEKSPGEVKKFNVATSLYNRPEEKKDLNLNSLLMMLYSKLNF